MDSKSHELFTKVLLNSVNKTDVSPMWGNCPDIDMNFLHRWYRHRISVIQKTYDEFPFTSTKDSNNLLQENTNDKDAVALCVVSHLYLDIFNGWVAPFGAWHIISPDKSVIGELFKDIDNPKIFIEVLNTLTGSEPYVQQFYDDSEKLMKKLVLSNKTEELVSWFVCRLASHATYNSNATIPTLYSNSMNQISEFTKNDNFRPNNYGIFTSDINKSFIDFEKEYCSLIDKTLENINK
jgi:hypothetical protein